jgi:hypothetical protein
MVLVLAPHPALAAPAQEGGDAGIKVEQSHPATTSVHYFVKLASDGGDGDPIDGATLTATPTSPDGTAGEPVTLTADGDGVYEGSVPLSDSGDWTVDFAATNPDASLSYQQKMPAEPFDASEDDGSSPLFPILFAAAFLLTLGGMGVWALMDRRRNRDAELAGGTGDGEGDGEGADSPAPTAD